MNNTERISKRITDIIVGKLNEDTIPWREPWKKGYASTPTSGSTKKAYRGVNHMMLASAGFDNKFWFTFGQIRKLGGSVLKGQKSMPVVFWKWREKLSEDETDANGDPVVLSRWATAFSFNVFNVEQTKGLPEKWTHIELPADHEDDSWNPVDKAEDIVRGYKNPPSISWDIHERAYYNPGADEVHLPKMAEFSTPEKYYATLFHELGHSTGHSSRLKRDGVSGLSHFGSMTYSKEELVAEMTAAFLCGHARLPESQLDNTAAYIRGWSKKLKKNTDWILWASTRAQKATDLILGTTWVK